MPKVVTPRAEKVADWSCVKIGMQRDLMLSILLLSSIFAPLRSQFDDIPFLFKPLVTFMLDNISILL